MGLTLLPLLWIDLGSGFRWLAALLVLHALAASTQDAAGDALAIASTTDHERGSMNGWMQAGMLAGRSVFGGGALMAGEHLGARVVPAALVGCVWITTILLLFSREPTKAERVRVRGFWVTLVAAARSRKTWFGLAFAGLSGAGFEAVGAVAGPFLIDRGRSPEAVGTFLAFGAVGAMLVGSVVGGMLSDRYGRTTMTAVFLVLCSSSVLALAVLPEDSSDLVIPTLTMLYLGIGLFVASSYALFMDLTDPRLGATQFSTFMAATNGCESWSSFAVGRVSAAAGYGPGFALMGLASLAALPLLRAIGRPPQLTDDDIEPLRS